MGQPIGLEVLYRWDAPSDFTGNSDVVIDNAAKDDDDEAKGIEMIPSPRGDVYTAVPGDDDRGHIRDVEEIRAMAVADLQHELEVILCDIVGRVGGELQPPVDSQKPLILLGMDSMSVIQFKGVLDNRCVCEMRFCF